MHHPSTGACGYLSRNGGCQSGFLINTFEDWRKADDLNEVIDVTFDFLLGQKRVSYVLAAVTADISTFYLFLVRLVPLRLNGSFTASPTASRANRSNVEGSSLGGKANGCPKFHSVAL
jgi:hypothetical protein